MAHTTAAKHSASPSLKRGHSGSRKQDKKRRREEESGNPAPSSHADRPSKKHRSNATTNDHISDASSQILDLTLTENDEPELSAEINTLKASYDVTEMNIISSSRIEAKVTKILLTLAKFSFIPPCKPNIVYLHAKSPCASKLISILEISKRNIAEKGGKWYQYNQLGEIKEEKKRETTGGGRTLADAMDVDGEEMKGGDATDFQFETMKTPFERAVEGKPKVRAVAILGIYLSRVRVESLKKQHGEQTNGLK